MKRTLSIMPLGPHAVAPLAASLLASLASAQTVIPVADLNPSMLPAGPASSVPTGLAAWGRRVLFAAAGPTGGVEAFVAAADPPGATSLGDLRIGALGAIPSAFAPVGDAALFVADDGFAGSQLWRTDGLPQGTVRVSAFSGGVGAGEMVALAGRVVFAASDAAGGREPWTSDGTPEGTSRLADINPGPAGSFPRSLVVSGSRVFYIADDGTNGPEVWVSENAAGAAMVGPLVPPGLSTTSDLSAVRLSGQHGVVFTIATYSGLAFTGNQVWFSDGSQAGTVLLFSTPGAPSTSEFVTDVLQIDAGLLLYTGTGSVGGTLNSIRPSAYFSPIGPRTFLPSLEGGASVRFLGRPVGAGDRAFFAYQDSTHGVELWMTDVPARASRMVADLAPGTAPSDPADLVVTPDGLYFSAYTPETGTELFRADLCGNSIQLVADILPGPAGSQPQEFTLADSILYFRAAGPTGGQELWAAILPFNARCPADFNADGTRDADDLSDYLTAYFGQSGFGDGRTDFNHDCTINADDLSDYITAYFGGCP